MRLQGGEMFDGRYELVSRIGSGGMADVWKARDTQLDRDIALKILHDNFSRDAEFIERFRREASSAAVLQHPNVVGVYDSGEFEESYYIAMELIEGASLRDLIERGIKIDESAEIAHQILSGAGFGHERGIVHRDLKPMNVLIDREGRVRVTDFGIALAGTSEITRTGSVMGTAQYLSPEQAQGLECGPTADIYAVGVLLFEMLTGTVPFDGDNAVAIAMKQVSEVPPAPSSLNPSVSPALDNVVLKAMSKDPANRHATAAEMQLAIDAAIDDPSASHTEKFAAMAAAVPVEDDDDKRWIWALLLAAVALGIVLAALLLGGGGDETRVPGVVGDQETAASLELQRAGFQVDTNAVENRFPEGRVIAQDPTSGSQAEKGSTVTLTVSLGPNPVPVPDVEGKPRARAEMLLKKANFEVKVEVQNSADVAAGRAIGTDPDARSLAEPKSQVTLTISAGEERIEVPSVVGQNRIDATVTLRDAGFVVDADSEDGDAPEDEVTRQLPDAGTRLSEGDRVTIVYSTGNGSIVLDDFAGEDADFAQNQLEGQGLQVRRRTREVDNESDDGVVLEQSPGGGSRQSPGDRVTLVVGEFIEPDPAPRRGDPAPGGGGGAPGSGGGGGAGGTP